AGLQRRTSVELKELCKERSLKVTGSKMDLVSRLTEALAEEVENSEKASTKERGGSVQDTDKSALEISKAEQEFFQLTKEELRMLCTERDLATTGTKVAMAKRLADQQALAESQKFSVSPDRARPSEPQPTSLSPTDRFIQALKSDQIDRDALEDIFNLQMPRPGEIVEGTVTTLMEWGAFVELDGTGWQGLIHVSEVTDDFVDNIEDFVRPGQHLRALVIKSPKDRM
ncbi:unnamed protein product, partial [Polarella glacialis]